MVQTTSYKNAFEVEKRRVPGDTGYRHGHHIAISMVARRVSAVAAADRKSEVDENKGLGWNK